MYSSKHEHVPTLYPTLLLINVIIIILLFCRVDRLCHCSEMSHLRPKGLSMAYKGLVGVSHCFLHDAGHTTLAIVPLLCPPL